MQNFNLPPGCTDFDIDRAAGITTSCRHCWREIYIEDCEEEDGERLCKRCAKNQYLADHRDDRDI